MSSVRYLLIRNGYVYSIGPQYYDSGIIDIDTRDCQTILRLRIPSKTPPPPPPQLATRTAHMIAHRPVDNFRRNSKKFTQVRSRLASRAGAEFESKLQLCPGPPATSNSGKRVADHSPSMPPSKKRRTMGKTKRTLLLSPSPDVSQCTFAMRSTNDVKSIFDGMTTPNCRSRGIFSYNAVVTSHDGSSQMRGIGKASCLLKLSAPAHTQIEGWIAVGVVTYDEAKGSPRDGRVSFDAPHPRLALMSFCGPSLVEVMLCKGQSIPRRVQSVRISVLQRIRKFRLGLSGKQLRLHLTTDDCVARNFALPQTSYKPPKTFVLDQRASKSAWSKIQPLKT
ncbi:hypothetical protein AAMO2058_001108800 [Amorphochlora amoebiformis]